MLVFRRVLANPWLQVYQKTFRVSGGMASDSSDVAQAASIQTVYGQLYTVQVLANSLRTG